VIGVLGVAYLVVARPHQRVAVEGARASSGKKGPL
jgi:hypothetical protein